MNPDPSKWPAPKKEGGSIKSPRLFIPPRVVPPGAAAIVRFPTGTPFTQVQTEDNEPLGDISSASAENAATA